MNLSGLLIAEGRFTNNVRYKHINQKCEIRIVSECDGFFFIKLDEIRDLLFYIDAQILFLAMKAPHFHIGNKILIDALFFNKAIQILFVKQMGF